MNRKQIFWLAALLALQATALSLLQNGQAQASQVYRCEGGYQQTPCHGADASSAVAFKDARTTSQVSQSRQLGQQDLKAFQRLLRQRQKEIRKAPRARAVALSSAKPGQGPFGATGPDTGAAGAPAGSDRKLRRLRQTNNVRVAKVPQAHQPLQAAAQAK